MKPFTETYLGKCYIRDFNIDVDDDELKWHEDKEDRLIYILEGLEWKLQIDNQTPFLLVKNRWYEIPKNIYHRIIKGNTNLKIMIIKKKKIKVVLGEKIQGSNISKVYPVSFLMGSKILFSTAYENDFFLNDFKIQNHLSSEYPRFNENYNLIIYKNIMVAVSLDTDKYYLDEKIEEFCDLFPNKNLSLSNGSIYFLGKFYDSFYSLLKGLVNVNINILRKYKLYKLSLFQYNKME